MNAHYRAFGGFRFALALTVVLSHTWFLTFSERNFIQDIGIGNFAVMGFFVLSGYIISEAVDAFYANRAGAFTANRLLRLVPPYWAAAVVSIAVHWTVTRYGTLKLPDYETPPEVMFSARNFLVQITAIIPVFNFNQFLPRIEWYYFVRFAWAIFVEFVFYFSIAICISLWPIAKRFVSLRTYLAICAMGAIAVHGVNEFVHHLHTSFAFIPYFVLGASLYWATSKRERLAWAIAGACYLLIAFHFTRYTQGQLSAYADWWSGMRKPVVLVPTVIMLAIPLIMLWLSEIELTDRSKLTDSALGDLTYPVYLNHYAVLVAIYSFVAVRSVAAQIAAIVVSLVLSWLLHQAIEAPMSSLRDRLRGKSLIKSGKAPASQIKLGATAP
ncbi:acyltransferase [Bradyrhizobium sp. WYCCWR 13023]|uniref:Acyltransferase n=1 Tax=Bradyrhizobium zhengyangense TaxID=2911009 RepID=A0A9X1UJZ8_9BRAD|nr:acyltransferase [Bradyrhizobium zhengyangense]MCG2633047.1 acyltransferase [Bradyrhizobium zhengyangense]